ncbi:MAG TPA: 4Fe-4S dicluster domain-containing protein [candidate division Zixibacteria bacterium]|nr:4Fe-4S dicluster domain-containing protein [candidate division Zixibacteria bacterium]
MAASGTEALARQYGTLVPTGRLADGKPRSILFDATRCIGCRHCVQACKDWNEHDRTSPYAISATNWITIEPPVLEGLSPLWARNSCMHCDYPACAAICPVEAITKYEEGPVVIDGGKCIGCDYCIHACPWGVIARDDLTGKAAKCTMCSDRIGRDEQPFCVQACPAGALDFGASEEISRKASERAGEVGGYVYGDREAGGGRALYVLKEKKESYGVRGIGPERFPRHNVPLGLMLKDLLTPRCGIAGKLRALYLAAVHPGRLIYRYLPRLFPAADGRPSEDEPETARRSASP